MRRLLGLLTLLVPAIASAQPGAVDPLPVGATPPIETIQPPGAAPVQQLTDPQVLGLARGAHAAAERGDCVGARALGSQIARLDPQFHAAVIKTDSTIKFCRPAERKYSVVAADEAQAPYLPAREGRPSLDGGIVVGEFLLGGLFTIGGTVGGGLLGLALDENCGDEECFGKAIIGAFLGGTFMAAVGVNLVGDSDEAEGSFGATFGGSVLGGLVGIGIVANNDFEEGSLLILVAAPTIGAMLGHGLTRKYTPQRAPRSMYDRRIAIQPSQRINDRASFTLASGTF